MIFVCGALESELSDSEETLEFRLEILKATFLRPACCCPVTVFLLGHVLFSRMGEEDFEEENDEDTPEPGIDPVS